jgi:hypothetical protein
VVFLPSDQDTSESRNDLLERMIHSFIIKIWREEPEKSKLPKWRGHITHVPSNERRYLRSLGDVTDFMNVYLQRMGVRIDLWWALKQWWKKRK